MTSYGVTGNQRIVDFFGNRSPFGGSDLARDTYIYSIGYRGRQGLVIPFAANPNLSWEEVRQLNVGIDFELLDRKLRGNIDFYSRRTDELFQNKPLSSVTGFTSQRANVGSIRNQGLELLVNYDLIRNNNGFRVNLYGNLNFNQGKVLDLATEDGKLILGNIILEEGANLYEHYRYRYIGANPANGNLLFLDANGNPTANPNPSTDRVRDGRNAIPDYQGGFGLNVDVKGFYIESQFNYVIGVYRYDTDYGLYMDPDFIGTFRMSNDLDMAWTSPGQITNVPSLTATNNSFGNSFAASDRFLISADYLRLRFLRFGFQFPERWLETIGLSSATVFVNGENLWTATQWRGFDPESSSSNSFAGYPTPKILTGGISLDF